jgi:hypothetical protein
LQALTCLRLARARWAIFRGALNIFQDDAIIGGIESSSGSVAGLRIFNNVLTDAEVAALDLRTPSAVPGPLPLFGAAAAFGWSRRLRKRIATPLITQPQA